MATVVPLQICADDFGLSDGIDLAILDLIRQGRLSATSCMMGGSTLARHAADLADLADVIDIGLHLTFTDLAPLGPMPTVFPTGQPLPLGQLMQRAMLRTLDYSEIKAEIRRQISRFKGVFGRAPDFVDGHQHVHVLPIIRRALFDLVAEGAVPRTTAVRNCAEPWVWIVRRGVEVPKTLLISGLSAGIAAAAGRLGMPTNDSFRGVTDFATDRPFGPTFAKFLRGAGQSPLAMCHPGLAGHTADPTDVIAAARPLEYAYLTSDAFAADLKAAGVAIRRRRR